MATEIASATMTEPRSSVELTRNSKGYGWVVKCYQADGEDDAQTLERVRFIDEQLRSEYGAES